MRSLKIMPALPALALLAACSGGAGGGGVSPAPAPAPSPTPTPTPTSTPTPTPTPTPTANTSLLDLHASQSFTNDAANGTASYPNSGSWTSTAELSTLTVSYDAGTGSYSISTGGRSQTFRRADVSAADSTPASTVYIRTSGNTTDSLTLTKPGTSGTLTYQYVGGGAWQRTIQTSSAVNGIFDVFTYGFETPAATLPRTGSANFDVDLIGVSSYADAVVSLSGTGTLGVDFGTGAITTNGTYRETIPTTGAAGSTVGWGGTATLSSANRFTGSFGYNVSPSGQWSGRFYGPSAEEVGAVFAFREGPGISSTGFLLGRRHVAPLPNTSLTNLLYSEVFASLSEGFHYIVNVAPGTALGVPAVAHEDFYTVRYDAGTQSFRIDSQVFGPANRDSAASNDRFDVYRTTDAHGPVEVRMYRPGAGNSELALTYTSFVHWSFRPTTYDGGAQRTDAQVFAVFGVRTPASAMPVSGSATYNGQIYGMALANGSTAMPALQITGTAQFNFTFGNSTFTGSMNPIATNPVTNQQYNLGTWNMFDTNLSGNGFNGHMSRTGVFDGGDFRGFFTGPGGEELGARFNGNLSDPVLGNNPHTVEGVIVGKRQP